jgi:hypothetical protein
MFHTGKARSPLRAAHGQAPPPFYYVSVARGLRALPCGLSPVQREWEAYGRGGIAADKSLRITLEELYRTRFSSNVAQLLAAGAR